MANFDLWALFLDFGRSDVSGAPPLPAHVWLANSTAHMALGGAVAFVRRFPRLPLWLFALCALKELAFDLPNDSFAPVTVLDSIADLAFYALGYRITKGQIERLHP